MLFLLGAAIKSRSAILGNACDASGLGEIAITSGAGQSFASVDGELMLEGAELAIRLNIIAQTRSPRCNRGVEGFANGGYQIFDFVRLA
jgi:hypothetical protein